MPKRFEEREFGYFRFNSQMIRHLSFNSLGDLRALIIKHVPKSVYYSVYYFCITCLYVLFIVCL